MDLPQTYDRARLRELPRRQLGVVSAGQLRGAVASHATEAELHGLTGRVDDRIHVTSPVSRRVRGRADDVVVHYAHRLPLTRHPTANPPRTRVDDTVLDLVDVAARARDVESIWIDVDYEPFHTRVELDGLLGHEGDGRFRDRRRDNAATVTGAWTLRYGHTEIFGEPCQVAQEQAGVLRDRGWTGRARRCGPTCPVP